MKRHMTLDTLALLTVVLILVSLLGALYQWVLLDMLLVAERQQFANERQQFTKSYQEFQQYKDAEDEAKRLKGEVQKLIDAGNEALAKILERKEEEIAQ